MNKALIIEQLATSKKTELGELLEKAINVLGVSNPITILISRERDMEVLETQRKWAKLLAEENHRKSMVAYLRENKVI